ncbi:hypothetical protein CDAR_104221 [Caerostris darwini]|uniref:Uncharacterized protein n=1 Tax=Caerostris darwini TaxID=1538125 RepID=A0AAV4QX25_9ARAC|nr:hypothetical protein CDAR_104221 [Caerostris darwini]
MHLFFFSIGKDQWAGLIVLSLQLWIYISVFRSRTKIRLLTEDLYRISNMLHAHTLQKKKMLKIYIWLYCLFVIWELHYSKRRFSVLVWYMTNCEIRNNSCTFKRTILWSF